MRFPRLDVTLHVKPARRVGMRKTLKKLTFEGDAGDPKWRPVDTIWPSMAAQAISIGNGSLMFSMVEESHEGQYMCTINNGIGSGLSKTVQLHVHGTTYSI